MSKEVMKKFTQLSLQDYLQELSSDAGVPGGGSVSAYSASLAIGLSQMVGKIALKRKIKPDLSEQDLEAAQQKRQTIEVRANPDNLRSVPMDQEVLWQVFQNILSNAMRYSPEKMSSVDRRHARSPVVRRCPPGR